MHMHINIIYSLVYDIDMFNNIHSLVMRFYHGLFVFYILIHQYYLKKIFKKEKKGSYQDCVF